MSLTREDLMRLARLARLDLAPEEVERFRVQLNSVLEQMNVLVEAVSASPPAEPETVARLGADEGPADGLATPVNELTSEMVSGFFTVPRAFPAGETLPK